MGSQKLQWQSARQMQWVAESDRSSFFAEWVGFHYMDCSGQCRTREDYKIAYYRQDRAAREVWKGWWRSRDITRLFEDKKTDQGDNGDEAHSDAQDWEVGAKKQVYDQSRSLYALYCRQIYERKKDLRVDPISSTRGNDGSCNASLAFDDKTTRVHGGAYPLAHTLFFGCLASSGRSGVDLASLLTTGPSNSRQNSLNRSLYGGYDF